MIDKLQQLISAAANHANLSSWPIVFANQNMPRVSKPYISLNVTAIDIPDHIYTSAPDVDGTTTVSSWRKASVDMQIYNGIQSLATTSQLALVLQTNTMLEKQVELNCAIGQRLFLGYVPELLNLSQYEGRGIYQFEFFYTESLEESVGTICGIEFHGQYIQTHSNPDTYMIFDPNPLPGIKIACHELIPCPEDLITIWDGGDTTWDSRPTYWDAFVL